MSLSTSRSIAPNTHARQCGSVVPGPGSVVRFPSHRNGNFAAFCESAKTAETVMLSGPSPASALKAECSPFVPPKYSVSNSSGSNQISTYFGSIFQ